MILPSTYTLTLAVLFLSMLCWGSWANTLKKSAWRFELYYLDFAIGSMLAALVAGFTLGSMGTDISVQDNFLLAGKRQIIFAFLGGAIFNLGNMLLVAAIELAGMSIAFPLGLGLALIVGTIWGYVVQPSDNALFVFGGCALVLVAVVFSALAYARMEGLRRRQEREALATAEAARALENPEAVPAAAKRRKAVEEPTTSGAWKGIAIAAAAGLLMGSFYPLVSGSMESDLGLTNPYAVAIVFGVGIVLTTFIYNLYFMNLPVKGLPISFFAYFTGTVGQHGLGLLGGGIWMAGAIASFVGAAATGEAKVAPGISYALGQGATLVSMMWGLLVWKEYADGDGGVKRNLMLTVLFFALGIGLVALAAS